MNNLDIINTSARVALILHIHDAELVALFHHEPVFRHGLKNMSAPAPADVFEAQNATQWAAKYRLYRETLECDRALSSDGAGVQSHIQSRKIEISRQEEAKYQSMFYSWARLSGIGATICEYQQLNMLFSNDVLEFEKRLASWFSLAGDCCDLKNAQRQPDLPFCLRPLWHQTFITLHSDLNLLEQAVGREGLQPSARSLEYARVWTSSLEVQRCLLHALCIQNLASVTSFNVATALHTPRVLFTAALCWQCYIVYSTVSRPPNISDGSQSFAEMSDYLMALPEFCLLREDRSHSRLYGNIVEKAVLELWKMVNSPIAEIKASTLCVLEEYLRQLTTNGISRKFADIVQAFILGGK